MNIRTVRATRYVAPLREGGSLPAIVEADDSGTYVLKFRGAGQGAKALIAELVAGEIARVLGLPIPEIVFVELDATLARSEPDSEIQELVKSSAGQNLALDFLPGSLSFDPLAPRVARDEPLLASSVVWFDAFISNVDRTPRNTNLLLWHRKLWLIDHGASLYFHHAGGAGGDFLDRARSKFPPIKDHVLLPFATQIEEADALLTPKLSPQVLEAITQLIPTAWLGENVSPEDYSKYLLARLQEPREWMKEAIDARSRL